jgi:CHAD domain-containing protein
MASEQKPRTEPGVAPEGPPGEKPRAARTHGRPVRGRKLRLPRRRPLREGILAAFSRILGATRAAARSADADPVAAVHEYRKSLRRARSIVSLLSPALGNKPAKGFSRRLQGAFRLTNPLRDADILLATLRRVPEVPEDDLARHAIEVTLQLELRRTQEETAQTLAPGLRSITALPSALEVTLDPDYSAHDLEIGLARSRRRERRALERARESGEDQDLHDWRKRVKELRYQVELLATTGSRELKKREKTLGELAQKLGVTTDLIVLGREIERRAKDGNIPPAPALLAQIRQLVGAKSREMMDDGSGLFEADPKQFARQVIAERG